MTIEHPHPLDAAVWYAEMSFRTAPPDVRMCRARKLIEAKFARGDFPVLQMLDEPTLEALARVLVDGKG